MSFVYYLSLFRRHCVNISRLELLPLIKIFLEIKDISSHRSALVLREVLFRIEHLQRVRARLGMVIYLRALRAGVLKWILKDQNQT